ncbi:MAG: tetratricopeptide repeat protein [Bacteroidota bacterium]
MNKLVALFITLIFCWNGNASTIEQLEAELKTADDSLRISILNQLCLKYQIRDPVKALEYGFEGIELAQLLNYKQLEAHLHNSVGVTYVYQSDYPKAADYHLKALRFFEQIKDRHGEAQTIFDMAFMYKVFESEYDTAISYYNKAYATFQELKDSSRIVNSLNALGIVHTEAKNFEQGETYFLEMLEKAKLYGLKNFESTAMKQLGWHFYNRQNYEKARDWYERAGRFELDRDNQEGYASSLLSLAYIFRRLEMKEQSLEASNQCVEIYGNARNKLQLLKALQGKVYLLNFYGEFQQAIDNAEQGIEICLSVNQPVFRSTLYDYMHASYDSLGNASKSLEYFKKHVHIRDSISNQSRIDKIAKTRALFDLDLKNKDLAIQKATLENQRNQIYFLIFALLLVVVASVLFIRKKNMSIKLKTANEELQRLKIEQMQQKNTELESTLEYKKRELISYSLNFVQKNNLINEIGQELKNVNLNNDDLLRNTLQKLKNKTNAGLRIDKNWEHFKVRFEEINPGFFKHLISQFPALTANELKICALASLNLSSKEIATFKL